MKRILFVLLFFVNGFAFGQNINEDSLQLLEPVYRLYYITGNFTQMLKLNTRTGELWVLNYPNKKEQYYFDLFLTKQVSEADEITGRFVLFPSDKVGSVTAHDYIMLDRVDGRCWRIHLQLHTRWIKEFDFRKYDENNYYDFDFK